MFLLINNRSVRSTIRVPAEAARPSVASFPLTISRSRLKSATNRTLPCGATSRAGYGWICHRSERIRGVVWPPLASRQRSLPIRAFTVQGHCRQQHRPEARSQRATDAVESTLPIARHGNRPSSCVTFPFPSRRAAAPIPSTIGRP